MKSLHEASKAFSKDSGMSEECWKLYDRLEDEWTKYNILYDAVKKLNVFLLGGWNNYDRDSGTLKELDQVCKVIEGGACAEIRLQGEDEVVKGLSMRQSNA